MTASKGIRSRRSDAGQVRLSERDAAVLRFLGEQFGCPLSVVADLYGVGDRVARRHVARLERAGFASRLTVAGQQ
jgi:DNA-binding MarR family transcriptional regulator